jgi:hypothetical protein
MVIVIIQLMLSVYIFPKAITLGVFHCILVNHHKNIFAYSYQISLAQSDDLSVSIKNNIILNL